MVFHIENYKRHIPYSVLYRLKNKFQYKPFVFFFNLYIYIYIHTENNFFYENYYSKKQFWCKLILYEIIIEIYFFLLKKNTEIIF